MIHAEAWIDLIASALVSPQSGKPCVLLHECQRLWPLLEARASLVHVHTRAPHLHDFLHVSPRQPMPRERLVASESAAEVLAALERAELGLVCAPSGTSISDELGALLEARALPGRWIVFGPPNAAGWASVLMPLFSGRMLAVACKDQQVLASPSVVQQLYALGMEADGLTAAFAHKLLSQRPPAESLRATTTPEGATTTLTLLPPPVTTIACASTMTAHHIVHESRALFNARGLASVLLPWNGCARVKLLLRNVRARIDTAQFAGPAGPLRPEHLTYTEFGAVASLALPPVPAGRDAMLHVAIPADAAPADGFCDIGAVEFRVALS